jgi:glycosyltransferase involved in cell wall biosynthesis
MENKLPLVSIIALNYNQGDYLVESLDAIAAQTVRDFEIIITDDCSRDDSRQKIDNWVLRNPDLSITKLYNDTNLGLCKTLNKAVALCRGEYIKPVACDDILHDDYLHSVVEKFNSGNAGLVFTDVQLIDGKGRLKEASNYKYNGINPEDFLNDFNALSEAQYVSAPSIIYKRSLYDEVGGYDEDLVYEDWDFLLKAQRLTKFGFINQPLVKYRVHETNMHRNFKSQENYVVSTIKILFRIADISTSIKFRENLAREICKLLIINEKKGIEFMENYQRTFSRPVPGEPLVSILVTSFNTAEFIESCITTSLLQTYGNIELLIVDDGSTDDTVSKIKSFSDSRIRLIQLEKNMGRVSALNTGIKACKGQYIALMDSDDMVSPLRIEKLMSSRENLDAVSSQVYSFNEYERGDFSVSNYSTDIQELKVKMLFYSPIPHAATLFKADSLRETAYRTGFDYAEDFEMLSRYIIRHSINVIHEPLYLYRRRDLSATFSINQSKSRESQKRVVENYFRNSLFSVSDEELRVLVSLEHNIRNPITDKPTLIFIRKLFQKILKINKDRKAFDEKVLERILLNNYWSTYYYRNANLHGLKTGLKLIRHQAFKFNIITMVESLKTEIRKKLK